MSNLHHGKKPVGADTPDQATRPKPWYARGVTWVGGLLTAVITTVVTTVVVNVTGLNNSGQPVNRQSIPAIAGAHPLKATVFTSGLHGDYTLVFPRPYALSQWQRIHSNSLTELGNNIDRLHQGFIASGAAYRGVMVISVTLTNRSNKAAQIVDANVVNRKWSKPWKGTLIYLPPQGNVSPSRMAFDLDREYPIAEALGQFNRHLGREFFGSSDIQVPPAVPTTVSIIAVTARYAITFKISFKYVINGATRTLVVGQGLKPFMLSATDCSASSGFPYRRIYSASIEAGHRHPSGLQLMTPEQLRTRQGADRSTLCAPPQY